MLLLPRHPPGSKAGRRNEGHPCRQAEGLLLWCRVPEHGQWLLGTVRFLWFDSCSLFVPLRTTEGGWEKDRPSKKSLEVYLCLSSVSGTHVGTWGRALRQQLAFLNPWPDVLLPPCWYDVRCLIWRVTLPNLKRPCSLDYISPASGINLYKALGPIFILDSVSP